MLFARLEHGAHSTTGLYTGTGSCRLHEYAGTAEFCLLLVRDSGVDDGNLDQILLCILHALSDSGSDLIGLSQAVTDDTVLVANDDDGCEAAVATALGYLGNPLDGDQSVLELKVRCLYSFNVCICHSVSD